MLCGEPVRRGVSAKELCGWQDSRRVGDAPCLPGGWCLHAVSGGPAACTSSLTIVHWPHFGPVHVACSA